MKSQFIKIIFLSAIIFSKFKRSIKFLINVKHVGIYVAHALCVAYVIFATFRRHLQSRLLSVLYKSYFYLEEILFNILNCWKCKSMRDYSYSLICATLRNMILHYDVSRVDRSNQRHLRDLQASPLILDHFHSRADSPPFRRQVAFQIRFLALLWSRFLQLPGFLAMSGSWLISWWLMIALELKFLSDWKNILKVRTNKYITLNKKRHYDLNVKMMNYYIYSYNFKNDNCVPIWLSDFQRNQSEILIIFPNFPN